jgi:hypothetical protein
MSQGPLQPVLKTYFRSHPFDIRFSTFITSLQKDPWFTIDTYNRRTDSNFFFLSGHYKNFNPFRFVPNEIRLVIAEKEIIHTDSLHTTDTIIMIQLIAIADSTPDSRKAVAKEFKHFNTSKGKSFSSSTYKKFDNNGEIFSEINNYFIYPFQVAPVTTTWGFLPGSADYMFAIIIRFKIKENIADLIIAPDDPVNLTTTYY